MRPQQPRDPTRPQARVLGGPSITQANFQYYIALIFAPMFAAFGAGIGVGLGEASLRIPQTVRLRALRSAGRTLTGAKLNAGRTSKPSPSEPRS